MQCSAPPGPTLSAIVNTFNQAGAPVQVLEKKSCCFVLSNETQQSAVLAFFLVLAFFCSLAGLLHMHCGSASQL